MVFVTDYRPGESVSELSRSNRDTVDYRDITIMYGRDRYLEPRVLWENCFIKPGEIYRSSQFDRTYEALGRLGILKSVNIVLEPAVTVDGRQWLDAYVRCREARSRE